MGARIERVAVDTGCRSGGKESLGDNMSVHSFSQCKRLSSNLQYELTEAQDTILGLSHPAYCNLLSEVSYRNPVSLEALSARLR